MLPQVKKLGEMALDVIFPQRCVGCGKEGSFICTSCSYNLPSVMPPVCPLCGRPQSSGVLCPDCISWQTDLNGIRSPFRFEGVIRTAVHQLKYRNIRALAPYLARFMASCLSRYEIPCDVIVPVPLHRKRLKDRGYNQSALLARELGKLSGLPVHKGVLIKHTDTAPQARTTNVSERRENVAAVFACDDNVFSGKRVVLIDDVATSGATLDACAGIVKEAGAESVWGLTLAREI